MTPSNLLAVASGTKVKQDDLLGYLVMFAVPDRMVEFKDAERAFKRAGLDPATLPSVPEPGDVFQQACMAVASKRRGGGDEVLVQLASHKDGEYVYQVTRSVRDADNKIVEHPKAMSVTFNSLSHKISVTRREEWSALRLLERTIRANYESFGSKITGPRIRTLVRETIVDKLYGTNYLGKGVYLVPKEALDTLESFRQALDALYGGDAAVVLIPMLATKSNVDDLQRFHADDIKDRAGSLIGRISERLQSDRAPRPELLATVVEERRQIKALRDRIVAIVGAETSIVDEQLAILEEQTEALFERAGEVLVTA